MGENRQEDEITRALGSQMDQLDNSIKETQLTLCGLADERRVLASKLNAYRDPIRRLPVELISRIFTFCTPITPALFDIHVSEALDTLVAYAPQTYEEATEPGDPPFQFKADFPIVLGMICQYWRQVARSTPRLWTSVPIRFDCKNIDTQVAVIRDWISLSKVLTLDIGAYHATPISKFIFSLPAHLQHENVAEFLPLSSLIRECSTRWGTLRFTVPPQVVEQILVQGYESPARLDELTIAIDPTWTPFPLDLFAFPIMPRQIDLYNLPLSRITDNQWTETIQASVENTDESDVLNMLRCLPNLSVITITDAVPYLNELEAFTHNGLCSIMFHGRPNMFFQALTAPNLRVLEICIPHPWAPVVRSFLERSTCKLVGLILRKPFDEAVIDEEAFYDILLEQDGLLSLRVHGNFLVNDVFLQRLTARKLRREGSPSRPFLPRLEHLLYEGARRFDWSLLPGLLNEGDRKSETMKLCDVELDLEIEDGIESSFIDLEVARKLQNHNEQNIAPARKFKNENGHELAHIAISTWTSSGGFEEDLIKASLRTASS